VHSVKSVIEPEINGGQRSHSYMLLEAVDGFIVKSLALIAGASRMLTDAATFGLALLATLYVERPATPQKKL
jgi:Co/Zn/Cd efflux system component